MHVVMTSYGLLLFYDQLISFDLSTYVKTRYLSLQISVSLKIRSFIKNLNTLNLEIKTLKI